MKEWLIRTKSHHILGPVSIEKLRELIANNSIKGDDEVCCGNGYWIFVREQELIKKYVFDGIKQDFNPVQEAEYVDINDYPLEENNSQLPSNEDLEYPDESLNKPSVEGTASTVIKKKTEKERELVKASGKKRSQNNSPKKIEKSKSKIYINPLYIIAGVFVVLMVVSIIFQDSILRNMTGKVFEKVFPKAYAQNLILEKKMIGS